MAGELCCLASRGNGTHGEMDLPSSSTARGQVNTGVEELIFVNGTELHSVEGKTLSMFFSKGGLGFALKRKHQGVKALPECAYLLAQPELGAAVALCAL